MDELTPVDIRIDEEALRQQVRKAVEGVILDFSMRLRTAADSLDPQFLKHQDQWIEDEIDRRVIQRLKEPANT